LILWGKISEKLFSSFSVVASAIYFYLLMNPAYIQSLQNNLRLVQEQIDAACGRCGRRPADVRLVVITKTHGPEAILPLAEAGISMIGENRVQEIEAKSGALAGRFQIQLVGHLQTNKVKKVVPLISMVQSVDSLRLALELEKCCAGINKTMPCLVQINTSGEDQKSGLPPEAVPEFLAGALQLPHLDFQGFMTIGPASIEEMATRRSFRVLREIRDRSVSPPGRGRLKDLSMGMSHDFPWAVEEGATIVRVGSAIMGQRNI
jgi:pyridoxal phosphate enzyme (YggS family)